MARHDGTDMLIDAQARGVADLPVPFAVRVRLGPSWCRLVPMGEDEAGTETASPGEEERGLLDRLRLEPDEAAIVSVAGRLGDATPPIEIVYGSVLFGPDDMPARSWPEWAAVNHPGSARFLALMTGFGVDLGSRWREFDETLGGWYFARWTVGSSQADRSKLAAWLADLLSGNPVVGGAHGQVQLHASAEPARSLIRTFPLLASPASLLCLQARRPVTGYRFPLAPPTYGTAPAPSTWGIDGRPFTSAPLYLLGLPVSETPLWSVAFDPSSGPSAGLLIGRLERGAWLAEVQAIPESGTVSVSLGLDETRVNLADLELDIEEYEIGELVGARRLRLGEVALPGRALAPDETVTVELPTLGPGLHRQVRLFDRDGSLLDATDRMPMVEQVTMRIDTSPGHGRTVVVGGMHSLTLNERLARADRSEQQYRELLEGGLQGRVIDDPTTGLPFLTAMLNRAHGHLDVLDPYFGWDSNDWHVLSRVPVPVRVLTGHGRFNRGTLVQKVTAPPVTLTSTITIEVRTWRSGTPLWHDRMYLWDGGGATVGTSPSGIGNRVARIDRVNGAEASGWQRLFDTWWTSPDVQPI
jgi:hypothetical protein